MNLQDLMILGMCILFVYALLRSNPDRVEV